MKFKVGDKVKVVGNSNSHCTPNGTVLTISCIFPNSHYNVAERVNIAFMERDLIAYLSTRTEIAEEVIELEERLKNSREKLSWLAEVGQEEFDEMQFKVYRAIQTLKDQNNPIEASRLITQIIREDIK